MASNFTPQQIEEFLQEFFDVVGARQYVGARYVPIFGRAGEDTVEWDDGAPYEPLTVVMHQGVSYVSRRYVPSGIQITDTAYWVETYRFNAQVEQYRQEVLGFSDRIDQNAQAIADEAQAREAAVAGEAQAREAADGVILGTVEDEYVPFPDPPTWPKFGTEGQVLATLANGQTRWTDPVVPSDAQAEQVITQWLSDHPEATTTVLDGAITTPKLANGAVTDAKMQQSGGALSGIQGLRDFASALVMSASLDTNVVPIGNRLDGSYISSGSGVIATAAGYSCNVDYIPVTPGTTFRLTLRSQCYGAWYDASKSFVEGITVNSSTPTVSYVTAPASAAFLRLSLKTDAWDASVVGVYTPRSSNLLASAPPSVSTSNYAEWLPTLADAPRNSVIALTMSQATHQSDYPTECGYSTYMLVTCGPDYQVQYMLPASLEGTYAMRRYYGDAWHDWEYHKHDPYVLSYVTSVSGSDYASVLPTLGVARADSIYTVSMSEQTHQSDYPTECGYTTYTLVTYGRPNNYREQYMIPARINGVYAKRRYYSGGWQAWEYVYPRRRIVIAPSGGEYSRINQGFDNAYDHKNCDVIVRNGTYDIVAEETAIHGASFFTDANFSDTGTLVGNGCTYYFEPGANVRCVLPANASEAAQRTYSPFMSGDGDFEITGLRVYSENCRYSFHDEMGGAGTYHHVYRDCDMHHNDTGAGFIQCIGGGLGAHGLIDVEGCTFASDTAGDGGIVSWHNGSAAGIQSFVNIRNCYFANGHVRFSWYGTSTDVSQMTVSGCSFATTAVEETPETPESTVVNTDVIAWNNELRGA